MEVGREDAEVGSIMSPVHPLLALESSDKPVFRRPGFQGLRQELDRKNFPGTLILQIEEMIK